jgi:hypothetical protein
MAIKKDQTQIVSEKDSDEKRFLVHKEEIRQAAVEARETITNEARTAAATISDAAIVASKKISEAAEVAVRVVSIKNADDHDLLIELKVGNQFIRNDIKDLANGVTAQIDELRKTKAEKIELDALAHEVHVVREKRIRDLENKTSNYFITMTLLMIAIGSMFTVLLFHVFGK